MKVLQFNSTEILLLIIWTLPMLNSIVPNIYIILMFIFLFSEILDVIIQMLVYLLFTLNSFITWKHIENVSGGFLFRLTFYFILFVFILLMNLMGFVV